MPPIQRPHPDCESEVERRLARLEMEVFDGNVAYAQEARSDFSRARAARLLNGSWGTVYGQDVATADPPRDCPR